METIPKRFVERIDAWQVGVGCWTWIAWRTGKGYGAIKVNNRRRVVHRVIYELLVGKVPRGMELDHLCRNRACVNPAHMECVTKRVNVLRGIGITAMNARKLQCIHGHELSETTRTDGRVRRHCMTCNREKQRRFLERRNSDGRA